MVRHRCRAISTTGIRGNDDPTGTWRDPGVRRSNAEPAEVLELIGRWREIRVDHFVMDFGNPSSIDPILRFSEQVIAPLR